MTLIELNRDELANTLDDDRILHNDVVFAGAVKALGELEKCTRSVSRKYYAHCRKYWELRNPTREINLFNIGYVLVMERVLGIPFLTNDGGFYGIW